MEPEAMRQAIIAQEKRTSDAFKRYEEEDAKLRSLVVSGIDILSKTELAQLAKVGRRVIYIWAEESRSPTSTENVRKGAAVQRHRKQ